jgi:hypothetical protein
LIANRPITHLLWDLDPISVESVARTGAPLQALELDIVGLEMLEEVVQYFPNLEYLGRVVIDEIEVSILIYNVTLVLHAYGRSRLLGISRSWNCCNLSPPTPSSPGDL